MILKYRSHALIEDLQVGECTMHRASDAGPARWWQLWFRVLRDTDGQPEDFCVPMNPGGGPSEGARRTWGLTCPDATPYDVAPGTRNWQVSPSINVLGHRGAVAGPAEGEVSIWHQTPTIVGVPIDEPWANGAAP
jgi:hypothetical protein